MTEAASVPRFRSGAGRPCLDFIRTLRHRGTPAETEELPDAAALRAWVSGFGPCGPIPAGASAGHEGQARELREAIYELIAATREGRAVDSSVRGTVNAAAAAPVPAPRLDHTGRLRWHADDPVPATLALLARDALDLVASPAIDRVRNCANPDCKIMFLDESRPGRRRWCSMNTCGNKAKKQTLRSRHNPPT